jgi:hypothetical protein
MCHGLNLCPALFMVIVALSARWLMCWPLVLLHVVPEGDPSVTILSALSFLIIHNISYAITSLNSGTLVFATRLSRSVFPQHIKF